jgi:hypothetical protein
MKLYDKNLLQSSQEMGHDMRESVTTEGLTQSRNALRTMKPQLIRTNESDEAVKVTSDVGCMADVGCMTVNSKFKKLTLQLDTAYDTLNMTPIGTVDQVDFSLSKLGASSAKISKRMI